MKAYVIAVLLLSTMLLYGCAQQPEPSPVPGEKSANPEHSGPAQVVIEQPVTGNDVEEMVATQVREFDITARQFAFEPGTIEVDEGDTVRLRMRSVDVAHGFVLSAFGIDERLNPGDEVVVEFKADKKGEFDFYCNVPCGSGHRNMIGTLIVR